MGKSGPPVGVNDQQELDRRIKKGAQVWDLKLLGVSNAEIASRVDVPLRTVQYWLKEDRDKATKQMTEDAATELIMIIEQNRNLYRIAMKAIEQTVTNEDGTQQVFMDHKSADIALKALKEMARLMALGAKEEGKGNETLEALILASLGQKDVPLIVEAEVVKDE